MQGDLGVRGVEGPTSHLGTFVLPSVLGAECGVGCFCVSPPLHVLLDRSVTSRLSEPLVTIRCQYRLGVFSSCISNPSPSPTFRWVQTLRFKQIYKLRLTSKFLPSQVRRRVRSERRDEEAKVSKGRSGTGDRRRVAFLALLLRVRVENGVEQWRNDKMRKGKQCATFSSDNRGVASFHAQSGSRTG